MKSDGISTKTVKCPSRKWKGMLLIQLHADRSINSNGVLGCIKVQWRKDRVNDFCFRTFHNIDLTMIRWDKDLRFPVHIVRQCFS
jgi:hypothetical protein